MPSIVKEFKLPANNPSQMLLLELKEMNRGPQCPMFYFRLRGLSGKEEALSRSSLCVI